MGDVRANIAVANRAQAMSVFMHSPRTNGQQLTDMDRLRVAVKLGKGTGVEADSHSPVAWTIDAK